MAKWRLVGGLGGKLVGACFKGHGQPACLLGFAAEQGGTHQGLRAQRAGGADERSTGWAASRRRLAQRSRAAAARLAAPAAAALGRAAGRLIARNRLLPCLIALGGLALGRLVALPAPALRLLLGLPLRPLPLGGVGLAAVAAAVAALAVAVVAVRAGADAALQRWRQGCGEESAC